MLLKTIEKKQDLLGTSLSFEFQILASLLIYLMKQYNGAGDIFTIHNYK